MNRTYALILAALALCAMAVFPALAQEKPEKPAGKSAPLAHAYAPEHCEFEIKFPEEPLSSHRCDDATGKRCYDLVTFTQVYELSSTVSFKVICNPIDKGVHEQYSPAVMEATLKAMTQGKMLKSFDSSVREDAAYKQAGLVGEGRVGRTPTIYIAQLWIGQKSALSVEAELIGDPDEAADRLYSDILKTVRYRGDAAKPAEKNAEEKSKPSPKP